MTPVHASPAEERDRITTYTIAARTFTGTPDEVAARVGELIESLAAAHLWLVSKSAARSGEAPADSRQRARTRALRAWCSGHAGARACAAPCGPRSRRHRRQLPRRPRRIRIRSATSRSA